MNINCPVCTAEKLEVFLRRENVPVHQNLLMDTYEDARAIERGDLVMCVCRRCGFVFNSAFEPEKLRYGNQYDNNQACSSVFQEHLDSLVDLLLNEKGVKNSTIVEVGCGQGQFIRRLIEEGEGNRGFGFDPSYSGPDEDLDGRLQFRRCYYDESCADIQADVVVCRHVIEHVPKPLDLLRSVRQALQNSANARVFFETPCVEWILENKVIWDFFYEHCSLFSPSSMRAAFEISGYTVNSVSHIFDGQYLWVDAVVGEVETTLGAARTHKLAKEFSQNEIGLIDEWRRNISQLKVGGEIALWGAGAKGTTFANLIDPDDEVLDCIIDINPNKQGKYIAGSGQKIVPPYDIGSRHIKKIIVMNPNYIEEVRSMLGNSNQIELIA